MALDKLPIDANATADFVERVNCLLDIMNSNKLKTNKWKRPLTLKTVDQLNELKAFTDWTTQWQFKSKKTLTLSNRLCLLKKA